MKDGLVLSGVIQNGSDYYPYGKKLPGRNAFTASYESYRYQFTGHEYDGETGYQYHGARYYNEELGRYMSVDPLAQRHMGWSSYAYVLCNPLSFVDPTGMTEEDPPGNSGLPSNPKEGKVYSANNGGQYTYQNGAWGGYAGEVEVNYATQRASERATGALYRSAARIKRAEEEKAYSTGTWSVTQKANVNDLFNFQRGLEIYGRSLYSEDAATDQTKKEWAYSRANASAAGKIVVGTMAVMVAAPYAIAYGAMYAPAAGNYIAQAGRAYHSTFGMQGGYANMAWNAGGQLAQAVGDPQNYEFDYLSFAMSGFVRNPTTFSPGTPLVTQGAIGVASSYIGFTQSGIKTRGVTGATTATSINSASGTAYANSKYGNNVSSFIINSYIIQPAINRIDNKTNR